MLVSFQLRSVCLYNFKWRSLILRERFCWVVRSRWSADEGWWLGNSLSPIEIYTPPLFPLPTQTQIQMRIQIQNDIHYKYWPLAEGFVRFVSKDKYSWVLWQIQMSNRIDDVLSSIDINLTPARFRLKDVSDFFDGSKEKEKRRELGRVERSPREKVQFSFRCWSTMRNPIGDCGAADWKSWEVWKQCERRRP